MQRLHIINKAILLSNLANVPFTTRFSQIRKTFFRIIGQKKNTQHIKTEKQNGRGTEIERDVSEELHTLLTIIQGEYR